uniref:Uncharacterized protein n=1 Tax=Aegilops tauschii subsp. strangulata TaxID=200361 RepID=A0A453D055_AEGTS
MMQSSGCISNCVGLCRPLTIEVETWDAKMKVYPHYQTLPLDPNLIGPDNKKRNSNSVTYLSESLQYLCKQVLIGMCREHFSGISFGGNFTSKQLLFDNGNFRFDTCVPIEEYSITSAFKDYNRISEIFDKEFCSADGSYPIHAGHLINFLACPPDLVDPRSEALIAYLTNHYSLLSHSQRIKMSEVLDSLRAMLGTNGLLDYKFAIGIWGNISWTAAVKAITGMKPVYLYDATYDERGYVIDVPYSNHDNLSLLHFSNNFFKHAKFPLQQREAAFSLAMKDDNFMPILLFDSAITFQNVVADITEDVQQFIDEVISMLGKNTLCCKRRDEPSTS